MKICPRCGFTGNDEKFTKWKDICKACRIEITQEQADAQRRQLNSLRGLGHNPINKWFNGSDAHHLRYTSSVDSKDDDLTIYVPRKLHKSLYHNGNTGENMAQMNQMCLEWYFANTLVENRNPNAVALYLKYCMMPEPIWISEPDAPKCT